MNKTLDLIKGLQKIDDIDLAKSFTQSATATSGLTFYDLTSPALTMYPVLTPLRNRIPRVSGGAGIQANWRAITGINTGRVSGGVAEGKRNATISHTTKDYLAAFRSIGLDDSVTFEADWAAQGFDDVKARAVEGVLRATMIQEELIDLGGNGTLALGTTPTPTVSDVTTGGTLLANTAYRVFCVALTLEGYQQAAGYNNGMTGSSVDVSALALEATYTRTNMDGSTDTMNGGTAQKSSVGTVTTANDSNDTHCLAASVTPVAGACAYAWFWGVSGLELLGAITTINSVKITATATGTQNISTMPSTDNSKNSLVYDGITTQIETANSGSYVVNLATGTPGTGSVLTSDGSGGCTEIETALTSFWNLYRFSPDTMYMGASVLVALNKLIIANGGAPLIRFNMDANGSHMIQAGSVIGTYLNKVTNTQVQVVVHPNMAPGEILFYTSQSPYPIGGVGSVIQKRLRRDYYSIAWPVTTRRYDFGTYFDGVLQVLFPPAFGLMKNIAH